MSKLLNLEEGFRQFSELCTNFNEIQRIECTQLTYNNFFWNYMIQNRPVIITSVSNNWPCRLQWITTIKNDYDDDFINKTTTSSSAKVNFDFLKAKINKMLVPVANCSKEYYNCHQKCEMDFHEYLDYWQNSILLNQFVEKTTKTEELSSIQDDEDNNNNSDVLYLKDWHLKEKMTNYEFYEVPIYFASDWLNEFLIDNNEDDYRFVYMGPKGSWTPFHADVFSSFSWSTNIFGIKRWLLLPLNEELKLKDQFGNYPFRIDAEFLLKNNVKYFQIDQLENETIFIPSGWYHQVINLTDTISINHNWFNGCNIMKIWYSLKQCMNKVINEINDCRSMENFDSHSQIMLKTIFGINYEQFLSIIEYIARKRIDSIKKNIDLISFKTYRLNQCHIQYDLNSIKNLIIQILNDDEIIRSNLDFISRCNFILEDIENVLPIYTNE